MPKKTYTVKSGDTLANISRVAYGVPNRTEDLIRSNPRLQFRRDAGNTDAQGNPTVTPGENLVYIIEPPLSLLQGETLSDVVDESIPTMHINGVRSAVPENTEATVHYDACCNTLNTSFVWDPLRTRDREWWGNPVALPEYDFFVGSRKITAGRFERVAYSPGSDATSRRVSLSGRTFTSALMKNMFPFSAYPLERKNETLTQIAQWACGFWGLFAEGEARLNERFKKAAADNGASVWDFLAPLATQRNSVMHTDNSGYALQIVTPDPGDPVAYWEYGVNGFDLPEMSYDTTQLHDTHIGISRSARKAVDKQTFLYELLEDNSVAYHDLENQQDGTSAESLQYQAIKTLRDFFTIPITRQGVLNDDGEHWNVGDVVAVKAPHAAVYGFTRYMVRSITYRFPADKPHVVLGVIPPEVYMGEILPRLPWDD